MIRLFSVIPAVLVLSGGLGGSCIISSDVDDFEIQLPDYEFHFDTSSAEHPPPPTVIEMPSACVASPADSCAAISPDLFCNSVGDCEFTDPGVLPTIPCTTDLNCSDLLGPQATCNQSDAACQYTQGFELYRDVRLSEDVPELQDLGASQFTSVRFSYVRMYVAENTFSIDTPPVELYIAPFAVASLFLPSDPMTINPDVWPVGTIDPIAAATSGHTVDVVLHPDGNSALTEYCRTPDVPFKFFVYSEMTFRAGDPIPEGVLTLQVDSAATVGLN